MSCETCKGYSSQNCPCCQTQCQEIDINVDNGIEDISLQIKEKQITHEDGVRDEVLQWCNDNIDSDNFDVIYELISDSLTHENILRGLNGY